MRWEAWWLLIEFGFIFIAALLSAERTRTIHRSLGFSLFAAAEAAFNMWLVLRLTGYES